MGRSAVRGGPADIHRAAGLLGPAAPVPALGGGPLPGPAAGAPVGPIGALRSVRTAGGGPGTPAETASSTAIIWFRPLS